MERKTNKSHLKNITDDSCGNIWRSAFDETLPEDVYGKIRDCLSKISALVHEMHNFSRVHNFRSHDYPFAEMRGN